MRKNIMGLSIKIFLTIALINVSLLVGANENTIKNDEKGLKYLGVRQFSWNEVDRIRCEGGKLEFCRQAEEQNSLFSLF